jgi:hypothetical protein
MNKPSHSHHPVLVVSNRPNEGVSVEVKLTTGVSVDGQTVTSVGVDLSKAPVPDRKFAADTCTLIVRSYAVKLLFGQERIDGKGLRSAIVVQMSRVSGANLVRIIESMKAPSLQDVVNAEGIQSEPLSPLPDEPPQALTLSANMAIFAMTGQDSCIDFYQASPFAMAVALRAKKLQLDPVVRVEVRTPLLISLIAELRTQLAQELKTKIGETP